MPLGSWRPATANIRSSLVPPKVTSLSPKMLQIFQEEILFSSPWNNAEQPLELASRDVRRLALQDFLTSSPRHLIFWFWNPTRGEITKKEGLYESLLPNSWPAQLWPSTIKAPQTHTSLSGSWGRQRQATVPEGEGGSNITSSLPPRNLSIGFTGRILAEELSSGC